MDSDHVPESLRTFICDYIDSVELLYVLLLLCQNPDREWTLNQLTAEIRSTDSSIEKRLNTLYSRHILLRNSLDEKVENKDIYVFSPSSEEIRKTVVELSEFYKLCPYRIVELIYSRPNHSLRNFANAFKIRKDE